MGSIALEPQNSQEYGKRLFPHVIDERAQSGSSRPFAYIAKSPYAQDGFEEISYTRLANAINRASWWIVNELGPLLREGDVFAYMGSNDLRYLILAVAAVKTSRKILVPSPRNTIEAQQLLFDRIGCSTIIYASALEKSLQGLFSSIPGLKRQQVPSLQDLLGDEPVPHFEYTTTHDTMTDDPVVYFHTSGSSGNPKPIGSSMKYFLLLDGANLPPFNDGPITIKDGLYEQNYLCLLPPFHAGGFTIGLLTAYFHGTGVWPHPDVAPTAEYLLSLLNQNIITSLVSPPSLLDALSQIPAGIDALSKLEHVGYCGGPLPEHVGNALAPRLKHLYSLIGATEYGWFFTIPGDSSKWRYIRFHPGARYRFEEVSEGIFELIIPNKPELHKFHGSTQTFPHLAEYRSRDLYAPVPGEDGWMRYQGRNDDLIVLSNGEKINPVPLESMIGSNHAVKGALIVGEYRFLPSLLVEVQDGLNSETEEDRQALLDTIWPIVEEANKIAPRFSRVPRSLIYLTRKGEQFSRAGKGTIQRQFTVQKFSKVLDELYSAAEEGLLTDGLELDDPSDDNSLRKFSRKLYAQALENDELKETDDVFHLGMDSLQVTIAVQKVKATLRARHVDVDWDSINPQFIYSSPTAVDLAQALRKLITSGKGAVNGIQSDDSHRSTRIQQVLDKYIAALPTRLDVEDRPNPGSSIVILTGSTGSLGSYLLTTLLSSPDVSKVICLNRSTDGEKRQKASHNARGLPILWEGEKKQRAEFLTADLSKQELGLGDEKYNQLRSEVTTIIHCGWKVDFNHPLSSFETTHIGGVVNLIQFSARSTYHASITFISSISTALNWIQKHPGTPVPESIIHDLESPENLGYGESKYIGERLVEAYSASTGVANAVLRVGQIAGPVLSTTGFWNKQEWFPSLIASSKYLGILPVSLGTMGTIDWIPVDLMASIITELSVQGGRKPTSPLSVYNLVNPRPAQWSSLLPAVQEHLGGPAKVKVVALSEWIRELEKSAALNHGYITDDNPAVKLLAFYKSLLKSEENGESMATSLYQVTGLEKDSSVARYLQPVSADWIRLWIDQWRL
ncbi:NRPS-like enzyme, putative [Paecilomyces variotii No. 5]|uniref:NRPS-like enzyme, putative n=1 Tax=Byssochlamys spectabilis (strain No. 5 / NBRC 109023) TaxID=1356009 RepID=V5FVT0_BYSSN|nr:NRPS-like enzyme, putative [Paecilomyces variotii No. 5]